MAKNKSLFKIEGTLDELTFYKTAEGNYVRMKGGVSKERIMNDPSFVRTRENMSEFTHIARTGKHFRQSLGGLLKQAKDNRLTGRMSQVLAQVKKLDHQSLRGQRQVAKGISVPEGKYLLENFDFNKYAPLQQVLLKQVVVDTATAGISIQGLIPLEDLNIPEGATHLAIKAAHLKYDFDTAGSDLQVSQELVLAIDMQSTDVQLAPSQLASGTGISFYLISILFYQEVNGNFYSLRNGRFNVLNILKIV